MGFEPFEELILSKKQQIIAENGWIWSDCLVEKIKRWDADQVPDQIAVASATGKDN